jgi:ATP-dependent Clp protease ATP-binding subunit ClpC
MPKVNVYLPDELADAVKEAGLPVSAICQRALAHAVRRVAAIRETVLSDDLGDIPERFSKFTARGRTILALAIDDARADGTPVRTEHLLAAMIAEGGNLALGVLTAIEVEPEEIAQALAARRPAPAGDDLGGAGFDESTQEALRLTVTEATSLGHNYVGSEHLLLGLIAEPDGLAGQMLRAAGADLRLARRAVVAAIAGYVHPGAPKAGSATTGADIVATLTAAVRDQLEPIVARLEHLESRLEA